MALQIKSKYWQSRLWKQVSIKLTFIPLQDLFKHGMISLSSQKFALISFVASRWLRPLAIQQLLFCLRQVISLLSTQMISAIYNRLAMVIGRSGVQFRE